MMLIIWAQMNCLTLSVCMSYGKSYLHYSEYRQKLLMALDHLWLANNYLFLCLTEMCASGGVCLTLQAEYSCGIYPCGCSVVPWMRKYKTHFNKLCREYLASKCCRMRRTFQLWINELHHKASSETDTDMNKNQHVCLTKNPILYKMLQHKDVNKKHSSF